ncbi:MAG: YkgJ family cysteine cluster protein [Planctomycetaceae bacterium]|nr:YkgJ family cysteine cluster protein [Planctomycetaceae bacterium]
MSHFSLELPTIQNWNCHSCSECCKQHGIFVTDEDKARIEQQEWTEADGIPAGQELFVKEGGWLGKSWYRLAQPNGACVFLDDEGLCRIHAKYGEPAKPLACRIYPYAFHPAGSKVAVSVRFSCPSVVQNLGQPVTSNRKEIRGYANQVVPANVRDAEPPELTPGTRLGWTDLLPAVDVLDRLLAADDVPVLIKLLRVLYWVGLIEQSKFDRLAGDRLSEFWDIIGQASIEAFGTDTPVEQIAQPTRIGRSQFRLLAGQYARKDTYADDRSLRGRWRLLQMALALTRGRGTVPPVQTCFREVPFESLEQSFGPLPDAAEEMFTRYFRVKIKGMHFFGRPYYGVPFAEGVHSLALVYPVVLWIARWIAVSNDRTSLSSDDIVQAITIADHNHGYSPAFGTWGFRRRVRNLAQMGDIAKLCAWYGQ